MFESSFVGDRVNALHGISLINKAGQKVKYYEVRTLRSSFTLFEMFCKRAFPTLRDKGALSLLTLQLQGCEAMSTDVMDIPYVFTAAWVGLLGAYLLWMSQCSKINRGTRDDPNFGFAEGSDDVDTASVISKCHN